ncbi:hypothetical protein Y032_0501g2603 [Ancylostoma ceylanicum]|uniref:Gamma-secretase subunit PEN-2 n=1 Tax=Ancylostoma ceylanicum TaxID=53326 RepID=A0A016WUA6_9BILA|nr:hypothetical protein Y032_0501g2603 [Ancylostoma ceylanicum]
MDKSKMSETTKVDLCRKYFIIGLFCLPLVWLTNFIWFFGEAFCRPSSSCNHTIRKYVVLSGLGVIFWFIVIFSWEFVFQMSIYRFEERDFANIEECETYVSVSF